jgi:hypothetical protein
VNGAAVRYAPPHSVRGPVTARPDSAVGVPNVGGYGDPRAGRAIAGAGAGQHNVAADTRI